MDNKSGMEQKKEINSQARVEIIDFGPIKITGNFVLKDMKRDKEESVKEILLCRCGNSANKPFCDDSHKK
jgi:CDGSH iron-sulfur domain-containing protein 3